MLHSKKLFPITIIFFILILLLSCNEISSSYDELIENHHSLSAIEEPIYVSSHSSYIDIKDPYEIQVTENIIVINNQNTSLSGISLWLPQPLTDLDIEDDQGDLVFVVSPIVGMYDIVFRSDLELNQSCTLTINYLYDLDIIEIGKQPIYYFQFTSEITYFTQNHLINIRLPNNTFIETKRGYTSYAEDAEIDVFNNRIYLFWEFHDLETLTGEEVFVLFGAHLGPTIPIWILVMVPLSAFLLGIGITYVAMRKKQQEELKKIGEIYLTEDQRNLLKLLLDRGGKLTQNDLVIATGLSKSKISRDLKRLEEQEFVEKKQWGRQYRVYLTEKGEKVIE